MKELLCALAKGLVENPEAVSVTELAAEDSITLHLHVDESDMGRIIGKQGRIAKAIRTIIRSSSMREGQKVFVEIG